MDENPDVVWIQLLINLSRYIDSQVSFTGRHSAQVADWVRFTARKLDFSEFEVHSVYWAALLHDIGKIGVPRAVLRKDGPLTETEWTVMRLHPTVGANIVRSLKAIAHTAPMIYYHQEKFDGSGYPEGLQGEDIPIGARILAVVDAYEAMTHDRVYRKARSHGEAISELHRWSRPSWTPWILREGGGSSRACSTRKQKSSAPSGTKEISAVPPWLRANPIELKDVGASLKFALTGDPAAG